MNDLDFLNEYIIRYNVFSKEDISRFNKAYHDEYIPLVLNSMNRNIFKQFTYHLMESNRLIFLKTYFHIFLHKLDANTLNNLTKYLLLSKVDIINSLDYDGVMYVEKIKYYLEKSELYKKFFHQNYKSLYRFVDTLNRIQAKQFEQNIILPLIIAQNSDYLDYIIKMLKLDISKIEFIGRGSHAFAFKVNEMVIKFQYGYGKFSIPMFYRINDFIIRKKFDNIIISVCPYGYTDDVTDRDILDLLDDFSNNDLVLTDKNYKENIAVVDYIIKPDTFRDVSGVYPIDAKESESFQRKKVKLIDQDYIYHKNDPDKHLGLCIANFK